LLRVASDTLQRESVGCHSLAPLKRELTYLIDFLLNLWDEFYLFYETVLISTVKSIFKLYHGIHSRHLFIIY
jgi:hypothetical protein